MNAREVIMIVRLTKGMCPAMQVDEYTPDAWALVLGDYSFDDAKAAVVELGRTKPFIAVSDIAAEIRRVRAARFKGVNTEIFGSTAPDPDDIPAYLEHVRAERRAIGDGETVEAVTSGEARPVAALLAGLSRQITDGSR